MAMSSPRNGNRRGLVAEINVTPLVDVMLVLLIIFMITAPMMTQGLDVDLPETTAKSLRQSDDITIVTVDKTGKVSIGELETPISMLFDRLDGKNSEQNRDKPIFLKADKDVPYGTVIEVMAEIKAAGYDKLGMITQPKDRK